MNLNVSHTTRYTFAEPVVHGLQRLRLKPKSTHGQQVLEWHMDFIGAQPQAAYEDQHNNHTTLVTIEPGVSEVVVTCRGSVSTVDRAGVTGQHSGHMPLWCFLRPTPLTRAGNRVRALVAAVEHDRADTLGFLHALSGLIAEQVVYEPGVTDVTTTAEQALAAGKGVCQDHAHVFISAGRLLDIPMRYVGGYLWMEDRVEQEAGHGWAEAHIPGLGWVGFDISNKVCPDERYIRVATGCDYSEAAPITGMAMGAGETSLTVDLSVSDKVLGGQQQQQCEGSQSQAQGG
ncbi:transglutaminase domain-containing protein [Novosphingobium colocasiae]|uniref:transglutaminase family protein n=1 Tax=Novosphingobium colocasiae TaxID=1256513 RepID=UPI0035B1199C